MAKEPNKGKAVLAAGAAMAFCGATLYAAEKVLLYLFRDVDPDRIEQAEEEEADALDAEESEGNME